MKERIEMINNLTEDSDLVALIIQLEDICLSTISILNAFNSNVIYDFNMEYLIEDIDENLKIGITKAIDSIYETDGDLFDYHELDFIVGNRDDLEELDTDFTKEQKRNFYEKIKIYEKLFNDYKKSTYNDVKKYSTEHENELAECINKILFSKVSPYSYAYSFDEENLLFSKNFIATIYNNETCDNDETQMSITEVFRQACRWRCQSAGESDVEYLYTDYRIENGKVKPTVSPETEKELQLLEDSLDKLCGLLKNNYV